jgi:hypothetical protein
MIETELVVHIGRTEDPRAMVHLAWDHTPDVALCGKRLIGEFTDEATECVVCAAIDADLRAQGL